MNVLVLCNGEAPPSSLLEQALNRAELFIAADGGANTAVSMGHTPDIVIGDLDSYEPCDHEPYEIIHDSDQYANDLEKALNMAKERGANRIDVLGATGQRLDHTLKNLSVLKQFNDKFESLIFIDAYGTWQLLPGHYSEELPAGTTVSLFPLSGRVEGITTQGLKYPLEDDFLENGVRDGSSNTVTENRVTIEHKEGDLLLFIAR